MNSSPQIGRIIGIPLRIHWTLLLVVLYVAWAFASFSEPIFGRTYGFGGIEPSAMRWFYSFLFAVLLFACVALHELGHSFIARKNGIQIKSITLYFFGGVASMEEIPRDPRLELQMAFAGPFVSGVVGSGSVLLSQSAAFLGENHPLPIFFWTLGVMNLVLMVFNLIPAFPMDGGRLLRAWFATYMPYATATRRAADIGKAFAILMFVLGLFTLNFLLLFVAFFVYVGASEEEKATTVSISLEGIRISDIMSPDVRTITSDMTLRELTELMFREKHRGYPVVEAGSLQGIVTITDLHRVPEADRDVRRVEEVMARELYVIAPLQEASVAMRMMSEKGVSRLPVMDEGRLVGIVSREDLVRAIELCSGRGY